MLEKSVFLDSQKPSSLILCLGFALFNFWIWQISGQNLLIAFLLVALTVSLYLTFNYPGRRWIVSLTGVLFIILTAINLYSNFDRQILQERPVEIALRNDRHNLLSDGLGFVFKNRLVQKFYRYGYSSSRDYQSNLAYNLNLNLYFFNNHPREYSGVTERNKFFPLLLPIFIIGSLPLLLTRFKEITLYLAGASLVGGLIAPASGFSSILFFPIINVALVFGTLTIISKLRR